MDSGEIYTIVTSQLVVTSQLPQLPYSHLNKQLLHTSYRYFKAIPLSARQRSLASVSTRQHASAVVTRSAPVTRQRSHTQGKTKYCTTIIFLWHSANVTPTTQVHTSYFKAFPVSVSAAQRPSTSVNDHKHLSAHVSTCQHLSACIITEFGIHQTTER